MPSLFKKNISTFVPAISCHIVYYEPVFYSIDSFISNQSANKYDNYYDVYRNKNIKVDWLTYDIDDEYFRLDRSIESYGNNKILEQHS